MKIQILKVVFITAAVSGLVSAESKENDWANVTGLKSGTRVEVIQRNLKRTSGALAIATPDGVTLRTEAGDATVARSEVVRVSTASVSRKKRALVGAVIGGVATAAAVGLAARNDTFDFGTGPVVAGAAVGGAGIGAALGASSGGPRTVYRIAR